MYKVIISESFQNDLEEILNYITYNLKNSIAVE